MIDFMLRWNRRRMVCVQERIIVKKGGHGLN